MYSFLEINIQFFVNSYVLFYYARLIKKEYKSDIFIEDLNLRKTGNTAYISELNFFDSITLLTLLEFSYAR